MKKIILLLISFIPLFHCLAENKTVSPIIAPAFGKVITIEAKFIEKPNTYTAQNLFKEAFLIEVISVDGKKLKKPLSIEYTLGVPVKSDFKPTKNKIYKLLAYETIYSFGQPRKWKKFPAQFDYSIYHKLIIKPKEK
jgi:hypothetical protein